MRRCVILCALLAVGCGGKTTPSSGPSQPEAPKPVAPKPQHDYQGWKEHVSAEAQFRVRFPAAPLVTPATGNMHMVGVPPRAGDDLEYLCQWRLRDQPFADRGVEEVYLKGQQLGVVNSSGGKLLEEEAVSADGFPGRRFVVETATRGVLHGRSYVAGKRIITLQVWGKTAGAVKSPQAVKFFDSLTISP